MINPHNGHIIERHVSFFADLRKQFVTPPVAVNVELYGQTSLRCLGPQGAPPAHISWMKNGNPLIPGTSSTMLVSAEGHLLVSQATLQVNIVFLYYITYKYTISLEKLK